MKEPTHQEWKALPYFQKTLWFRHWAHKALEHLKEAQRHLDKAIAECDSTGEEIT